MVLPGLDGNFWQTQLLIAGWLPLVLGGARLGMSLLGGFKSMFGGPSKEEKMAMQQLNAQAERANSFYQRAMEAQQPAADWYRAVLRGDISRVPTARKAAAAVEPTRQAFSNLNTRSGGAASMLDPYRKMTAAWDQMGAAAPAAASGLAGLAGQNIGGMQGQSAGAASLLQNARQREQDKAAAGKGFFDVIDSTLGRIGDWWGSRGGGSTPKPPGPMPGGWNEIDKIIPRTQQTPQVQTGYDLPWFGRR